MPKTLESVAADLLVKAMELEAMERKTGRDGGAATAFAFLRFSNGCIQDWLSERLETARKA